MAPPLERLRLAALDRTERPPMNQAEFDAEFGSRQPIETPSSRLRRRLRRSLLSPCLSLSSFGSSILSFLPIVSWVPEYSVRQDLLSDVVGGLTTGIMHVPQGIAYSVLAGVSPVNGLYASCFPAFFYMFFGTSRHTSLGSFAVVALMAGIVSESLVADTGVTAIQAATAVAFSVGIWQLLCALLRLQFLLSYFSAPLVSGFTTGAAVHVLVAQLDDILGVEVPKSHGPGYVFVRLYDLACSVPKTNIATLLIAMVAMCFLIIGKEFISPILTKKCHLRLPIPYELIVVILGALFSHIFDWNEKYGVLIVGDIPAGIPTPSLPPFGLLPEAFLRSASIGVVTIAIHVSMAKMLANKFSYKINVNQELYALGFSCCLGSCFPIYAVSTALGRTMVSVRSGTRTQLAAIFSCGLLLAIILWLGPLLTDLPKCVLAAIITIALQSLFEKLGEPRKLWPISRFDALTWTVAFIATVAIDVMEGLAVAVGFAVLTVVMRTQWPHWQYFVPTADSAEEQEVADVAMFRFEGPLQFTNAERFKNGVSHVLSEWDVPRRPTSLLQSPARFFVIDCSAIVYVDSVGAEVLAEACKEIQDKKIVVYMASATEEVRRVLMCADFLKTVAVERFFPSVRDAISTANRNATACRMLCSAKQEANRSPSTPRWTPSPGPIVRLSSPSK